MEKDIRDEGDGFHIYMYGELSVSTPRQFLPSIQPRSPYTPCDTETSDACCQAGATEFVSPRRPNPKARHRPVSFTPIEKRLNTVTPERQYNSPLPATHTPRRKAPAQISSPIRRLRASFDTTTPTQKMSAFRRVQRCLAPRFNPLCLDVQGFNPGQRVRSRWLSLRGSPHFNLTPSLGSGRHVLHPRQLLTRSPRP